jgi:hypothetical protein
MSYESIDTVLDAWASDERLWISREFKDSEVRSVQIVSDTGNKVQIWVDRPTEAGVVGVHAWDYRDRREDMAVAVSSLRKALDTVTAIAREWLAGRHSVAGRGMRQRG